MAGRPPQAATGGAEGEPAEDRSAAQVLADRVAAALIHHEPGWRLPRRSALARRYGVSPAEMEVAIEDLSARHLLRRLPDGQVYRASPADYLIGLEGLPELRASIDPMGMQIDCASRHVSWRRVPEDIGGALGLSPGDPVCVVRCLWTSGGRPGRPTRPPTCPRICHSSPRTRQSLADVLRTSQLGPRPGTSSAPPGCQPRGDAGTAPGRAVSRTAAASPVGGAGACGWPRASPRST